MDKIQIRAFLATAVDEGIMGIKTIKTRTGNLKCWYFQNTTVTKEEKNEKSN